MNPVWVRHAPVRVSGLCYGRCDVPTALPARAAAAVVQARLPARSWQRVWTSPISRCFELAVVLAHALDAELRPDPRLAELDYGKWEGRLWEEIRDSEAGAYTSWMADWQRQAPPEGESAPELQARVCHWRAEVEPRPEDLVVAHAGVIRAWLAGLPGGSWMQAMSREVPFLRPLEIDDDGRFARP